MEQKQKNFFSLFKLRKMGNKHPAFFVSLLVVCVFAVLQALEIRGADTSQVTLTTDVQSAVDVSCTGSVSLGTLVAGTPVSGTTTCTTTTNSNTGYSLRVKRDDATGTLKNVSSTYIPDKTAWDPTASAGSGNAALWSGTGLGFRVRQTGTTATYNSTWWGANDAAGAKYAGVPAAYAKIMDHASYSASPTDTVVEFKTDVTAGQATGAYSGTVTFQVVALP